MDKINKLRKLYPVFVLLTGIVIFIKTTAPDVTTGDSGELLASAYCLGIGHPPGYPLYLILAKLFYYISYILNPIIWICGIKITDQFAYRVNLLSGVLTSLSMFVFYFFIKTILRWIYKPAVKEQNESAETEQTSDIQIYKYIPEISLLCSFIPGGINLIWSQSTNAEVYTLNMFLLILNFFVLTKFSITHKTKYLNLFAFLYGLNIVAHQTSFIFAPVFGIWILYNYKEIIKNFRLIISMGLLFILGFGIYFYMPIRSSSHPPLDWGNTADLKNFVDHIFRRQYGQLVRKPQTETILQAKRSAVMYIKQLATVFKIIYKNLTLPIVILVLIGIYELYRKKKKLLLFWGISVLFYILIMTYITNFKLAKLSIYVNEVFFIPVLSILLLFLPFGIYYFVLRTSIKSLKYFCFLPVLIYGINFHLNDEHKNYIIPEYTKNIFFTVEKDSRVFVMGDNTTFPIAYYYYVRNIRPDILFIGEYGFVFQDMFKYANVTPPIPNNIRKRIRDKIEEAIIKKGKNPVYYTYAAEQKFPEGKKLVPYGIIYKMITGDKEKRLSDYAFFGYHFDSMNDKMNYQDLMDRDMVSIVYYHIGEYLENIGETILAGKYSLKSKFVSGTEYAKKRIHYNLALDYKKKGEIKKAIKELLTALEIDPNYAKAHSLLGNIYSDMGRPIEAINEFKQALKNDPDNSKTYNNIGVEYYKIGKKEMAFNAFKKAIKLDPANYEAYNNIAVILEDYKKYNEAVAMYKKAIKLNPNYKDAYYNLGTLYLNAGKAYLDEAFRNLNYAIKIYPQYADAYYNLGILYQKKRDYKSAIPYFEKATRFKPNFAEAVFNIGVCYLWLKDYRKAERFFKKAIRIKPSYYLAYKHLGNTYYFLNDLASAYKAWEKAYKLNPKDKELENNLNVLRSQGYQ